MESRPGAVSLGDPLFRYTAKGVSTSAMKGGLHRPDGAITEQDIPAGEGREQESSCPLAEVAG